MLTIASLLFLIMDPFGNMIVVSSLLGETPRARQWLVMLREGLIAALILVAAAWFGDTLLTTFGLQEYSLRVAGGIVLFMIALGMLFPTHRVMDEPTVESPLVVPIAMPLIAGPGAISMAILLAQKHPAGTVSLAIAAATAASTLVLALSPFVYSLLGRRGSIALERLMGMLLILISVQMTLDGVTAYVESLESVGA